MKKNELAVCGYCILFVLVEIGLYVSYRHHDARFHWFLHFFVGASAALLVMSAVALRNGKPVRFPLIWVLIGHLIAFAPDGLFTLFSILHAGWMDIFLIHISAHFMPGRNLFWYAIFLVTLAFYLGAVYRVGTRAIQAVQAG